MGTPKSDSAIAPVHQFYSPSVWIEGAAEDQLFATARLSGVRGIAAFPDLHPGKYGPVGCAILSERIHPHLIGNDIGCGMSLFRLDIPARKLRAEKVAKRLRVLQGPYQGNADERLRTLDLPVDHAISLGTIGGGNHFCEVLSVDTAHDDSVEKDVTFLLVHSGSRGYGTAVFAPVILDPIEGFEPSCNKAVVYLAAQERAVRWAALNRTIIAERAAKALRADVELVADSPHNLIEVHSGGYLHRKGAAKADIPLVPLAGSRDALSYLLRPKGGVSEALDSLAHGAGRRYDRRSMHGRVGANKTERERLARTSFGGHVVCEDRDLLIEEAPGAYKDAAQCLAELEKANLVECVAAFKPLVTFKKAEAERSWLKQRATKGDRR